MENALFYNLREETLTEVIGLKRFIIRFAAVAAAAALMTLAAAADEEDVPAVDVNEVFVSQQGLPPRLIDHSGENLRTAVSPGSVIYFSIENARRAEDLNGYRTVARWDEGEEAISHVRIEYREVFDAEGKASLGYRYVIAMGIAQTADGAAKTLGGSIKLAERANQRAPEITFAISVSESAYGSAYEVLCRQPRLIVDFSQHGESAAIDFDGFCRFEVAAVGQGEVDVGCSGVAVTDIAERHRGADLKFIRWTKRPVFDHVGRLTVFSQDGYPYLYEMKGGKLYDVSGSYIAEEEAYIISTRRLEGFVLSDRELSLDAPQIPEANPPTGVLT